MMMHHILSIVGMTVAVITGKYGTEMIATIFGSEITNPLLQTRWFIRETGCHQSNPKLATAVDFMFMSSFGFFRIGVGSYLLYTYFCQETDNLGRFAACTIYGISWIFWVSIMQYAFRKFRRAFFKNNCNESASRRAKTSIDNHNNSNNASSEKVTNGSLAHKHSANGSVDNIFKNGRLANEIRRNGYHGVRCDDGVHLKQRVVSNGLVDEKLIHTTVTSSQVN